jgi:uncharacterized membrane protein
MEAVIGLVIGFVLGQALSGWLAALFLSSLGFMVGLVLHGINANRARSHVKGQGPAGLASASVPVMSSPQAAWVSATTIGTSPPHTSASARPSPPTSVGKSERGVSEILSPIKDNLAWLWQGNVFAKFGALLLFVGIAYLLRHAAQYFTIPPVMRIGGAALLGALLIAGGIALNRSRQTYAVILEGLGVAVLYLTAFAALALYRLIDTPMALTAMVGVSVGAVALSLSQRSQVLAVIAMTGGFLAPIVASTGTADAMPLLSYYTVLNLVVALIAWFQRWPVLNLVGFAFTFVFGIYWADAFFRPAYVATTLPFAILHYAIYLAVTVLFAWRATETAAAGEASRPPRHAIEGTLLFGVPAAGIVLFARLLEGQPVALAGLCVGLAVVYAALAWITQRRPGLRLLTQSFLALAVVFATIAAPIGLTAQWSSAIWAVQGAAVLWVALRQRYLAGAGLALLLQYASIMAYLVALPERSVPIINPAWLGALVIAAAFGASSALLARFANANPKDTLASTAEAVSTLTYMTALAVWLWSGVCEIRAFAAHTDVAAAICWLVTLTYIAQGLFARLVPWTIARFTMYTAIPVLFAGVILIVLSGANPLAGWGAGAWILAMTAAWLRVSTRCLGLAHPFETVLLGWTTAIFGAHQCIHWARQLDLHGTGWMTIAPLLVPLAMVAVSEFVSKLRADKVPPDTFTFWRRGFADPLIVFLAFLTMLMQANEQHSSSPWAYVPVLNPVDAFSLAVLAVGGSYTMRTAQALSSISWQVPAFGALALAVLTGAVLRCVHQWTGIDYSFVALKGSALAQSALSLTWSMVALALMLVARREARRDVWMTGATLLAMVAAKFIWFDFANRSTLEGIIAMIGVGTLFLIVGYVAPMPPKRPSTAAANDVASA